MRRFLGIWLVVGRVLGALTPTVPGAAAEPGKGVEPPSPLAASGADVTSDAALTRVLASRPDLKLRGFPLDTLVESLRLTHKINVVLDQRHLEAEGIDPSMPLSIRLTHGTLGGALQQLLQPLKLAYFVRDGVLVITTQTEAERQLRTVVYDVSDFLRARGLDPAKASAGDYERMIEILTSIIDPTAWDAVGGFGAVRPFAGTLVISQTDARHEQIAELLRRVRRVCLDKQVDDPAEAAWAKTLGSKLSLELHDTPLSDAVVKLSAAADVDVVLARDEIDEAGLPPDPPARLSVKDVTLEAALRTLLEPLGLGWVPRHGVIVITTEELARTHWRTGIYDVRDLLPEGETRAAGEDYEYSEVLSLLTDCVSPETWQEAGGAGSLVPFEGFLIVLQGEPEHDQITDWLKGLQQRLHGRLPAADRDPLAETLAKPTSVSCSKASLDQTLATLSQKAACPIVLDRRAAIRPPDLDAPLTISLADVPLATVLDLCLQGRDLWWSVARGQIVIYSAKTAAAPIVLSWHDVADLLPAGTKRDQAADRLAVVIRETVSPSSWDMVGGPGRIVFFRGNMGVAQTAAVQRQVSRLLADLRKLRKQGDSK
ncbi:MAG: hypothetical protein NTY19_26975 [Planctomycetota bacterium]|nr:hypothetical protein [Planctomycetota bacterium]